MIKVLTVKTFTHVQFITFSQIIMVDDEPATSGYVKSTKPAEL